MENINLTTHHIGFISIAIFVLAYFIVMVEEFTHLRKSKPVIISATLIWGLIAFYSSYNNYQFSVEIEQALEHNIIEFAELFLFLLTAMTYISFASKKR